MTTSTKAEKATSSNVVDDPTSSESADTVTPNELPAWQLFVDESTRENYRRIARDIGTVEGTDGKAGLSKLAAGFKAQHDADPNAGWDHLAAWAESEGDPGDGSSAGDNVLARAMESAKRDPGVALVGHPNAVAAAVAAVEADLQPVTIDAGTTPNTSVAVDVDLSATK